MTATRDWIQTGINAHRNWERRCKNENECDAEKRVAAWWESRGASMSEWWEGWFRRSDEWRDEIGVD